MLPEIYIVRHGQSQTNVDEISCGVTETDLTELGVAQAKKTGEFLRSLNIKKAFVSSLRRTRQTFDALALEPAVGVEYDDRLWELDFGEYEARPFDDFSEGVGMENILADWDRKIPGGESVNDVKARLAKFFEEKLEGVEGPVLLVSHGMTSRMILMLLTAGDEAEMLHLDIGNCEVWNAKDGDCRKIFDLSEEK